MINATITLIKNNQKSNISYSQSFANDKIRSYNFTGTLTSLEGFLTSDGHDISDALINAGVGTTVIISNVEMAEAIIEKAQQIYTERLKVGDKNPAIELSVTAKSLKVPGNILISFVTQSFVTEEAFIKDDAQTLLKRLEQVQNDRMGMAMARMSKRENMISHSQEPKAQFFNPEEPNEENKVTKGNAIGNFFKRHF